MKILTVDALNFARRHITAYYDTDFFPKPFEFQAIWHCWNNVTQELTNKSLVELFETTPYSAPWRKPRGGFRIVHQLDPIDALIYTALVYQVAEEVEAIRFPKEKGVACSYRIDIAHDGFFAGGSGFDQYRERCENLAQTHPFVLAADISDFYNQIYLHRVENALEQAVGFSSNIAREIENFLNRLNSKASQGVPVGPAASIVLTEAALADVDQFILNEGFDHVRYVDDFRIFGTSTNELEILLERLSLYIHENHRLSFATDKTRITTSENFLRQELNNQYQLEKLEILKEIEVVNPYTMEVEDLDLVVSEDAGELLSDALKRIIKFEYLDLGVARAIIRRAKAHKIPDIAEFLIENIEFFAPVINDVALYLDKIAADDSMSDRVIRSLEKAFIDGKCSLKMVRWWLIWLISRNNLLLNSRPLRHYVFSSEYPHLQALAAITENNVAWVREKKNSLTHFGNRDRRAIIYSSSILSKDERENWLKPFKKTGAFGRLDRWVVDWTLADCPPDDFGLFEDDIPF